MAEKKPAVVVGGFDGLLMQGMRFLQEAAASGPLHVQLWSDSVVEQLTGKKPKFPVSERAYLLNAVRYVDRVTLCHDADQAQHPGEDVAPMGATWVVEQSADRPENQLWAAQHKLAFRVVPDDQLEVLAAGSEQTELLPCDAATKVLVTGCYDWFHSGHVRFFEEVSELGALYVVVGHDENIRLLKGAGHPMFPGEQRRFIAGSIKFVQQAFVSTGDGWLDAAPEIERIHPDIYAVNEDGDRPEKKEYCETHGIEYRVLKRTPREGLPRRQSTDLRGF